MLKVLVLGGAGMLGSAVFRLLGTSDGIDAWATIRTDRTRALFSENISSHLISNVDVLDHDALVEVLERVRPSVVVNCIGLVKQLAESSDPLRVLPINSIFPHRLAKLCALAGARVIHISTDCVFSGRDGKYTEACESDAQDLYGKSKFIGEPIGYANAITLRTSIIGHELTSRRSLIDWFLSQRGEVRGYRKAIFSGLPTVELARVIRDYVIPKSGVSGLFHVASHPIDKYSLLELVAKTYIKEITIIPDDQLEIDRSLDSSRFREVFGYEAPPWPELVQRMYMAH